MTTWEYLKLCQESNGPSSWEIYVSSFERIELSLVFESTREISSGSTKIECRLRKVAKGFLQDARTVTELFVNDKLLDTCSIVKQPYGIGSRICGGSPLSSDLWWNIIIEHLCSEGWEPFAADLQYEFKRAWLHFKRSKQS